MKTTMRIAMILTVVFCFILVQSAISGKPVKQVLVDPIWKIFEDGTAQSVEWVDAINPRFALYNDEMVLDKATGLVWQQNPLGSADVWTLAVRRAHQARLGGLSAWRLPTVWEFGTLFQCDEESICYLPHNHPFEFADTELSFWSASQYEEWPESRWMLTSNVHGPGLSFSGTVMTGSGRTWLVRGGN